MFPVHLIQIQDIKICLCFDSWNNLIWWIKIWVVLWTECLHFRLTYSQEIIYRVIELLLNPYNFCSSNQADRSISTGRTLLSALFFHLTLKAIQASGFFNWGWGTHINPVVAETGISSELSRWGSFIVIQVIASGIHHNFKTEYVYVW
jgi:hypothetical protein